MLYNFENIPAEMHAFNNWVCWKQNGSKVPIQAANPIRKASSNRPETWNSFAKAHETYEMFPSLVDGIGFVNTADTGYVFIDVDSEDKILDENLKVRRNFIEHVLTCATYIEVSPSGKGWHIICKGKVPFDGGKRNDRYGVEIYPGKQFLTMTGWAINEYGITEQQEMLDSLLEHIQMSEVGDRYEGPLNSNIEDTTDYGRRLDMRDEEVLAELEKEFPQYWSHFNAQELMIGSKTKVPDWSETVFWVLAALDCITGNVDQIYRIMHERSGLLDWPVKPGDVETRRHKFERTFTHDLKRIRDEPQFHREGTSYHGKKIAEAFAASDDRKRREAAEAICEKDKLAERYLPKVIRELYARFSFIREEDFEPLYPPGVMGELVRGIESMMPTPFVPYCIPAAFALVSGMAGRMYKVRKQYAAGLNLTFILGATSASGKTQVIDACTSIAQHIADGLKISHPMITRLPTSSATAIHKVFMETPSCGWFVDECAPLLNKIRDDKDNTVNEQLKTYTNSIYDASKHSFPLSPFASVSGTTRGIAPIRNASISCFWATVPEKVEVDEDDIHDGFLSRVIIIRHKGVGGRSRRDGTEEVAMISDHLLSRLADIAIRANGLNQVYWQKYCADKAELKGIYVPTDAEVIAQLVPVNFDYVEPLRKLISDTTEDIKLEAQAAEDEGPLSSIGRLATSAQRMAATMAVLENPNMPIVTEEQLRWAFAYVLKHFGVVMQDMLTGLLGKRAASEISYVRNALRKMMKDEKYKKYSGVPISAFCDKVSVNGPFRRMPGRQKIVRETIQLLVEQNEVMKTQFNNKTTVLTLLSGDDDE